MCVHGGLLCRVEQHETKREHRYIWCDLSGRVKRRPGSETGASAGHYGRTQEPQSQRLIMGPHLTTTYLTVYIQLRDQWSGLDVCKCLYEFKCANVCWDSGSVGTGLDTGGTVSRETGICLKTTYSVSCVCLGNAANQRRVHDLQDNECQHYTNASLLAVCHNFTERSAGL